MYMVSGVTHFVLLLGEYPELVSGVFDKELPHFIKTLIFTFDELWYTTL